MFRGEGQGIGERLLPLLHGLVGQAVDEVQTQIGNFGTAHFLCRFHHLLPAVDTADGTQHRIIRRLNAKRNAIETQSTQGTQTFPIKEAVGICLHGDLGIFCHAVVLFYSLQQLCHTLRPQIAGRAAAKIHCIHRMTGGHRSGLHQMVCQRPNIVVHLLFPTGKRVKVAVGTF